MKKLLILLGAIVLFVPVLSVVGCGKKPEDTGPVTMPDGSKPDSSAPATNEKPGGAKPESPL